MSPTAVTKSEIFTQRLVIAVLWNICMQVILAVMVVLIIQVDLFHPILWLTSTINDIISAKMSFNLLLLVLVSVFQAFIYGKYHLVPPPNYFTRFSILLNFFTFQNMSFCMLYGLSGYFTMSLYSSLAKNDFYVLKKICQYNDGQCLIEESLFLQLGGMWMGVYFFISRHILTSSVLIFPHVHQDKYHKIKLAVKNVIITGLQNAIMPSIYYCIFYIIWGHKPRALVSDVYSLYLEDEPMDNVFDMVCNGLLLKLWIYTSLFFISAFIMRHVFNIVLTEAMAFPIESETKLTLHNALSQRSQFNGALGAQDLRMLSLIDSKRRLEIFTLSLPGGHPRNWNNIFEICLTIINEYIKDLENIHQHCNPDANKSPAKIQPTDNMTSYNMRNMAQSPALLELREHTTTTQGSMVDLIKVELNQFMQKLCQKPGISYFFGELTDNKLKYVLMQAQPVMWTCEGLANLAAASLTEDKYGIVQHDLPAIITSLVHLKQILEKISKLGLLPRKPILSDCLSIRLKSALVSSVKRSIYKIIITFSKYINDIPLDPDVQLAVQPFLLCKEA